MPGPGYPRLKDTDQGLGPKRRAIDHSFGVACLRYIKCCPKLEAQVLGKLLLQLGTFVEANCREAHRGRSKAEFIAKCGDSRRKLEKNAYLLKSLVDGEIVAAAKLLPLRTECDELERFDAGAASRGPGKAGTNEENAIRQYYSDHDITENARYSTGSCASALLY